MVNLCISIDHRILDGLQTGKFMNHIKQRIEQYTLEKIQYTISDNIDAFYRQLVLSCFCQWSVLYFGNKICAIRSKKIKNNNQHG